MDPANYWPNLKTIALPIPGIIAIGVFGAVANFKFREKGA